MKRVFAAIRITPEEKLLNLFYELKGKFINDRINWVKENNIHITVKFYGGVYESKINEISRMLKEVCSNYSSFSLDLKKLGVFGSIYNPRVIWIGIENSDALKDFNNNILERSHIIGFRKDRQNFVPHITLGRIKQLDSKDSLRMMTKKYEKTIFQSVLVNEIYLYESMLLRTGAKYNIIESFRLHG